MANVVEATFTRDGVTLVLRLVSPDLMIREFTIWTDRYEGDDHTQGAKFFASERRAVRWYNRRANKLVKVGWKEVRPVGPTQRSVS
jgi:hypothetical protein